MRNDNFVQIVGSVGQDPELRFTTGGTAVCSFSVAWTPRKRNAQTGEWEDGDTSWFRCTAWREMAENVAASIVKGTRVIVTGQIAIRPWTDNDGNERISVEIQCDEVSPSLRWAQATIERNTRDKADVTRSGSNKGSGGGGGGGGRSDESYGGSGYEYGDEEPFVRDARISDL